MAHTHKSRIEYSTVFQIGFTEVIMYDCEDFSTPKMYFGCCQLEYLVPWKKTSHRKIIFDCCQTTGRGACSGAIASFDDATLCRQHFELVHTHCGYDTWPSYRSCIRTISGRPQGSRKARQDQCRTTKISTSVDCPKSEN